MNALPNKSEFLQSLEGLSYHERTKKAYEFGRDNASSPQLTEWINEMRKVQLRKQPLTLSTLTLPYPRCKLKRVLQSCCHHRLNDDELLLTNQKHNIAKFFVEDQVAVAAAIGSKTQSELLVNELNSPSKWFQNKAAKEVSRQVKE